MNIYEQQQANRKRTWLIVAVFIVFFAFLGLGFDYFYLGHEPLEAGAAQGGGGARGAARPPSVLFAVAGGVGGVW